MRSRTGRIAGVLCLALSVASGASAQSRTFKPEDHYRLRSAADVRLSPDGSTVAFVERFIDAQHRTRSYIWLLTLADGKQKRLSEEDANDSAPHWSPDGKGIAFLTGRVGTVNPASTGFLPTAFGSGLAVARLDTGKTDVVAEYTVTNHPLAYQGSAEQIAWAPDGNSIAYLSADDGPEGPPGDPKVITRYGYKSWSGMLPTTKGAH